MHVAHFEIPFDFFLVMVVVCVIEWDIEVKVAIMRQLHPPVKELCTTQIEDPILSILLHLDFDKSVNVSWSHVAVLHKKRAEFVWLILFNLV